ncbi:MAG: fibronectin type III domain-containing protein, partial [Methylococcales bacterium]|nr:fibronectin type III domain-containing protein [Methylococcales bacterium]
MRLLFLSLLLPVATLAAQDYYMAGGSSSAVSSKVIVKAAADVMPPVISGISEAGITTTSATIGWDTDEPATSLVEYGLTTSYGSNVQTGLLGTLHALAITGLTPNTLYHYRITSVDGSSNSASSVDRTFTTQAVPAGNTTTASLVVSDNHCPAPCPIHFDATGTTDSIESQPFRKLRYDFTFGDPSAGNHIRTGKPRNTQNGGPLAAHVYDAPGTYTATLLVGDDSAQQVITVTDPDTNWSGTDTVCISTSTSMAGCPSGAQQLTNQSTWPSFASNKRYLLRAGQSFV